MTLVVGTGIVLMAATPPERTPSVPQINFVEAGKLSCRLVVVCDGTSESLLKRSAQLIADRVKLWSGSAPAIVVIDEAKAPLPTDQAIVFTTLEALQKSAPSFVSSHPELAKAKSIDKHGFAFVPLTLNNVKQLFVVSQTARGVFNGAAYLQDFCIDGTKENLYADFQSFSRSPEFGGRPAYVLSIWGYEAKYTAADWKNAFERLSRDGIDRVYFWVSGHFPSKKFPQTYKCVNMEDGKPWDTTVESKIGTVEDLKNIIDSAHEMGLKIYLGGALGSWCGTTYLTNREPETLKLEPGTKSVSLCPSHPKCRKALFEYYQELYAALPGADGLFIESADEAGTCNCERCSKPIDQFGSRQFGQSQLSLCQEIMNDIWKDHPQAKFAYTIGYQEHVKDPAYYQEIARLSKDPRFEWMEARSSWEFPGPEGKPRPASSFSDHVMRWQLYETKPLELLVTDANRAKKEGLKGVILDYSPGYTTGSFYKDYPFNMEILPYTLTGFVHREATWSPATSLEEMRQKTQQRFFGKEAPTNLADDVWKLREIIRSKRGVNQLDEIEKHIAAARPNASPKTIAGLDLMTRAITDIRKYVPTKRGNAKKSG